MMARVRDAHMYMSIFWGIFVVGCCYLAYTSGDLGEYKPWVIGALVLGALLVIIHCALVRAVQENTARKGLLDRRDLKAAMKKLRDLEEDG